MATTGCPPDTAHRMRAAHRQARITLGVQDDPGRHERWGWHGRTLGHAVTTPDGPAWLRVAAISADRTDRTFFTGAVDAHAVLPTSVPRPRLRTHHDFGDTSWHYRAELYDRMFAGPPTTGMVLTTAPDLPSQWWCDLRTALDTVAAVPTDRVTISQTYLDTVMPRMLGFAAPTTVPSWSTAHGDLHFANLCAPTLHILDWEGFGLAPTGYDAAMLHTTSLLVPATAAQIRHELGHVLDTPEGRFAELVTITELLHSNTRGDHLALTPALHDRLHTLQASDALPAVSPPAVTAAASPRPAC